MAIPVTIPIMQMEEYHTEYIGCTQDGRQFMAFQTVAYAPPYQQLTPAQRQEALSYRQEYVVLHLFDAAGNYLSTTAWHAGTSATSQPAQLDAKLQELLATLGPITFGDVEVKLFQTQIDGITFGLVADEEAQHVRLLPNDLLFLEPWDGEYYT